MGEGKEGARGRLTWQGRWEEEWEGGGGSFGMGFDPCEGMKNPTDRYDATALVKRKEDENETLMVGREKGGREADEAEEAISA